MQILSTKLLAKRSNLKLKSVTIIHSATTETVRLPENNNGVIVHTAVRTKVPFKKKVRGERSKKTGASLGASAAGTAGAAAAAVGRANGVTKVNGSVEPKTKTSRAHALAKKKLKASLTEEEVTKKSNKKLGKHIKETIDYSHRNNNAAGIDDASTLSATANNTFGKVQKWLLESPIVAQPLSHIEHSSRVRNVMSKSQSTPERLVQKTPQKTKSMGNLSNEKVKLQVVYKPPFKFSLRLSKKPKVKTHVVGVSAGARPKRTQKSTARTSGQAAAAAAAAATTSNKAQGGTERTKRAALLMCNEAEDDNQILTLNEPNYETLKPPTRSSTEHCYENVELPGSNGANDVAASSKVVGKIAHSSSRTSVDPVAAAAAVLSSAQRNSYRRSNSLSTHNPFAVAPRRSSSKVSKTDSQPGGGSINLTRNFGSTQNLINLSQGMAKSKKRSSLNLKASATAKNGKDPPTAALAPAAAPPQRRSTSNSNLRRNSSTSNSLSHAAPVPPTRNTRNSFSNIPRASLNGQSSSSTSAAAAAAATSAAPPSFSRQSSSSTTTTASSISTPGASHPMALQQSASASAMASQRQFVQPIRRSLNNFRTRSTAAATASSPLTALEGNNELPSDLEVVVSDIENLVS